MRARFARFLDRRSLIDLAFVIALFVLALPSVVAVFQVTPLEYHNVPFPVVEPVVKAGDVLTLTVSRCNRTNEVLPYTVARILIDLKTGAKTQLTDASSFIPPGCETVDSKLSAIPETTISGEYRIDGVSTARVGSRVWNVEWSTQPFKVMGR